MKPYDENGSRRRTGERQVVPQSEDVRGVRVTGNFVLSEKWVWRGVILLINAAIIFFGTQRINGLKETASTALTTTTKKAEVVDQNTAAIEQMKRELIQERKENEEIFDEFIDVLDSIDRGKPIPRTTVRRLKEKINKRLNSRADGELKATPAAPAAMPTATDLRYFPIRRN